MIQWMPPLCYFCSVIVFDGILVVSSDAASSVDNDAAFAAVTATTTATAISGSVGVLVGGFGPGAGRVGAVVGVGVFVVGAVVVGTVVGFYFDAFVILSHHMYRSREQRTKKREQNQIMTNNTNKMNNQNQRDEYTLLGVDHSNTTKECDKADDDYYYDDSIRRSPKSVL